MDKTVVFDSKGNDITCMKEFNSLRYPCNECIIIDCEQREKYNMTNIKKSGDNK